MWTTIWFDRLHLIEGETNTSHKAESNGKDPGMVNLFNGYGVWIISDVDRIANHISTPALPFLKWKEHQCQCDHCIDWYKTRVQIHEDHVWVCEALTRVPVSSSMTRHAARWGVRIE